jgi:hypothetical protein
MSVNEDIREHKVSIQTESSIPQPAGTGAGGFIFEELVDQTLRKLIEPMAQKGISARLLNEQQIRDEFGEQSLNGVDHFFALTFSNGDELLFLIQEKWKYMTNQREVSQFLDCCARILARMPEYKGGIKRLWVTRTAPTVNGEKSLREGGAYVIQSSTSMAFLAQETAQFICEILGYRDIVANIIATMPPLLPSEKPLEPATKGLQEKSLPANAIHPAKVKVHVLRGDS